MSFEEVVEEYRNLLVHYPIFDFAVILFARKIAIDGFQKYSS